MIVIMVVMVFALRNRLMVCQITARGKVIAPDIFYDLLLNK